ncbi:hemin uptake protein HemP [Methylomonas sp. MED-D]|uniref:Hemin transporter HemP n=1 Tax=Methylomonas koyamae TaxID=702114 RepID=A0A177NGE8_9GAMM|nr:MULTISPECIES: hemin uptake protein HemP [Methylomonas]MDT4331568.1 hemin uptake protein HemP [Methylomonas sp. MV1]NJA05241.1 hemin uptake protein HemP [Methylococcaceae bacterium WWC4]OAI16694.1 hemin transporter HemP [Methylomonas koyamae]WGS84290.1 hemin uptake protein HemP [Methylomonas sp. UP202]
MTETNTNPTAKTAGANAEALRNRPRLNSRALFGAQTEIVIEHQGEEYRLRITSNGKLILTK